MQTIARKQIKKEHGQIRFCQIRSKGKAISNFYKSFSGTQTAIESRKDAQSESGATAAAAEEKTVEAKPSVEEKAGANQSAPAKKSNANERVYIKGSRGDCYEINDSGKKTYRRPR